MALMDFIFSLHFVRPVYVIEGFDRLRAAGGAVYSDGRVRCREALSRSYGLIRISCDTDGRVDGHRGNRIWQKRLSPSESRQIRDSFFLSGLQDGSWVIGSQFFGGWFGANFNDNYDLFGYVGIETASKKN